MSFAQSTSNYFLLSQMLSVPIATEAASLISFRGEAYFIHSHVLMFVSDLLQFSGFLRYSGFLHQ